MLPQIRQERGLSGPSGSAQASKATCPQCAVHEMQNAALRQENALLRQELAALHDIAVLRQECNVTAAVGTKLNETKPGTKLNETKPSTESPVLRALAESLENSKMAAAVHVLGKAKSGRPSQGQPWIAAGMSKSQWYRQRKAANMHYLSVTQLSE